MSLQGEQYDELAELLSMMSDVGLDMPQGLRLAELVRGNSVAQRLYLDFVELHTMLVWQHGPKTESSQERGPGTRGRAARHIESSARSLRPPLPRIQSPQSPVILPSVPPHPVPGFLSTTLHGTIGYFSQEMPFSLLIATVVTGLALWIGSLITIPRDVEIARKSVPTVAEPSAVEKIECVGRITGTVDCRWADPTTETIRGAHVSLGRKYAIASGMMEITYNTGAKVILQGPVTYEVESPTGGFLSLGKLTAQVEKWGERRGERGEENDKRETINDKLSVQRSAFSVQRSSNPQSLIPNPSLSTSHHPLFTIKTPSATVTDLGTEFGVEVTKEGQTTSHVFRGKVEVRLTGGKESEQAIQLGENESIRVERGCGNQGDNRVVVLVPTSTPSTFMREIPKRAIKMLDLVDVVAGGDGFSGRRNRGIDPTSGRVAEKLPEKDADFYLNGDGRYHRVEGLPFVDGVFIPNSGAGPVQIDSAGHAFAGFYVAQNKTCGYVWAGGAGVRSQFGVTLDCVDYASPGHGVLLMHANKAVTFDLEAIRHANPDCKLVRFRAVVGNTETAFQQGRERYADLWVLVDGRVRFQQRKSGFNGASWIVVPLSDNDRFLTLAATDGGNGIDADWTIFGDPRLELLSAKVQSEIAK